MDTPDSSPAPAPTDPAFPDWSNHPHDSFVKAAFQSVERARDLFQKELPAEMVAQIDWSTLKPEPTNFISRKLLQTHSDLLFSASIGEEKLHLVLLFEHQTTIDSLMPLRLLSYMVEVFWHHVENLPKRAPVKLPLVFPFVLSQGPEAWTVNRSFHAMFPLAKLPEAVRSIFLRFLPAFDYAILDLTEDSATQGHHGDVLAVLLLMKLIRQGRGLEFFDWLSRHHQDATYLVPTELFGMMLWYALHGDESLDAEKIFEHISPESNLKKDVMTAAQKLIERGREEGREEGLEKGREKGREEGLEKGEWIGRIRLLQKLCGLEPSKQEQLEAMDVAELGHLFAQLEAGYDLRFKR